MPTASYKLVILCSLIAMLGVWCHLTPDASIASPAKDSHVTATVQINASDFTVGDHIRLLLTVRHPEGVIIELPRVTENISPFEILDVRPVHDSKENNQVIVEAEYKITSFSTGELALPRLKVRYTEPSGVTGEIESSRLPITISSVLNPNRSEQAVKDVKSPISISKDPVQYQQLAQIGAGALALVLILSVVIRRWPRITRAPANTLLDIPPEEKARRDLERIEALYLGNGRANYVEYYSSLAECIRSYLAEKYGAWTLGCTTKELKEKMEASGIEPWQARVVYGLLDECDSVRWARYSPVMARAERAITLAYEIVGAD